MILGVALLVAVLADARLEYCSRGVSTSMGRWSVCCASNCSQCDVTRCEASVPECCPKRLATKQARRCSSEVDVGCRFLWEGPEGPALADLLDRAPRAASSATWPPVHVAVAGDKRQLMGTIACARSVVRFSAFPRRLRMYVVTDRESEAAARRALECTTSVPTKVVVFDGEATLGSRGVRVRAIADPQKAALAAPLNYARFYLSQLLGLDAGVVVYLDSDVLVLADVVELAESFASSPRAIAVVARPSKPVCGSFLNCKEPSVLDALKTRTGLEPPFERDLDAFNAGVMLFHLENWRAFDLTKTVEEYITLNADLPEPLYKLGSNPPLVLAVRNDFERLDPSWNCQRGDRCWDAEPKARHWSGPEKPWHFAASRDKYDWFPIIQNLNRSCLGPDILLQAQFGRGSVSGKSHKHHRKRRKRWGPLEP